MNSFIAICLLAVVGVALAAPAAKYGHDGGHHPVVVPGPAVVHTYPALGPVVKCGHNLLLGCGPHHAPVPCHAHAAHGYGHAPAPAHHHEPAHAPEYHHAPAPAEYRAKKHKKHHKKHFKAADDSSSGEMM